MLDKHEEALKRLDQSHEICVDVETSGLDWRSNHIVGYVLSFGPRPQDSYYLPFRHAGGGNIEGVNVPSTKDGWRGDIHPMEQHIVQRLSRSDLYYFGHNIAFDNKFMYRHGLKFRAKQEDTQINAALINEWQSSFTLDNCAKVYGVAQKKIAIYDYLMSMFPDELKASPKQAMGHFWRLAGDDPQTVDYAEGDGVTTWQVRDAQQSHIAAQELKLVHNIECRLLPVLSKMMTRGVRVDEDRLHEVKKMITLRRDEALASLPKDFNSRAPTQVRALMEEGGFLDWPLTVQGRPSFPEDWLSRNPIGKQIVAVRKYSNVLSSFIEPMLDHHIWNGRVHPEYNQLRGDEYGTITGRLSSSNPNLQQVHKRNKELGRLYRSAFIPDDGKIWGTVDYSQCEPRLLAYYSRCKVLMDGYSAVPSIDAHTAVTRAMNLSKGYDEWTPDQQKEAREMGKRINQTLITGGGKKVIVEKYGVDPKEVDEKYEEYFKQMPEIKTLQRRASDRMKQTGYVHSLLMRRARLFDRNKSYVAVNRLLQLGNADILKLKMVELDDYFEDQKADIQMLNNVHDAFDFQFDEDNRKHYTKALEIMTSFGPNDIIHLDIPMEIDAGEGPNWAIATWGPEK